MTDFSSGEISSKEMFTKLEPGDIFPNYGFGGTKGGKGTIEIGFDGKAILHYGTLAPIKSQLTPEESNLYKKMKVESILYPQGYITRVNPETKEEVKIGKQYLPALQGLTDDDIKRMCIKNQVELPKELQPKRRPPFTPFEFGIDCRLIAALIKMRGKKSIAPFFDEIRKISIDLREKSNYKISPNDAIDLAREIIQKNDIPFTTYVITYASLLGKNYFLNKQAIQELALEKMSLVSSFIEQDKKLKEDKLKEEKLKAYLEKNIENNPYTFSLPKEEKKKLYNKYIKTRKGLQGKEKDDKLIMIQTNIPTFEEDFYGSSLAYDLLLNSFLKVMNKEEQKIFLTTIICVLVQFIPDEILATIPDFDKSKFMPSTTNMKAEEKIYADKYAFEAQKIYAQLLFAPVFSKINEESVQELFKVSLLEGGGILKQLAGLAGISYGLTQGSAATTDLTSREIARAPAATPSSSAVITQANKNRFASQVSQIANSQSLASIVGARSFEEVPGASTLTIYRESELFIDTVDNIIESNPLFQNWLVYNNILELFKSYRANTVAVSYKDASLGNVSQGYNLKGKVTPTEPTSTQVRISNYKSVDDRAVKRTQELTNDKKRQINNQIMARNFSGDFGKNIWIPFMEESFEKELQEELSNENIRQKAILKNEIIISLRKKLQQLLDAKNISPYLEDPDFNEVFDEWRSLFESNLKELTDAKKAELKKAAGWMGTVRELTQEEIDDFEKQAIMITIENLQKKIKQDKYIVNKLNYLAEKQKNKNKKKEGILTKLISIPVRYGIKLTFGLIDYLFYSSENSEKSDTTSLLTEAQKKQIKDRLYDKYFSAMPAKIKELKIYEDFYRTQLPIVRQQIINEDLQRQRNAFREKSIQNQFQAQYGEPTDNIDSAMKSISEGTSVITNVELFTEQDEGIIDQLIGSLGKYFQTTIERKEYADVSQLRLVRVFYTNKKTGKKYFLTLTYNELHKLKPLIVKKFLEAKRPLNFNKLSKLEQDNILKFLDELAESMPYETLLPVIFKIQLKKETSGDLNRLLSDIRTGNLEKISNAIKKVASNQIRSLVDYINQNEPTSIQTNETGRQVMTVDPNKEKQIQLAAGQILFVSKYTDNLINNGISSTIAQAKNQDELQIIIKRVVESEALKANLPTPLLLALNDAASLYNATRQKMAEVGEKVAKVAIKLLNTTEKAVNAVGEVANATGATFSALKKVMESAGPPIIVGLVFALLVIVAKGPFDLANSFLAAPIGLLKACLRWFGRLFGYGKESTPTGSNNRRGEAAATPAGSNNKKGEAASAAAPAPAPAAAAAPAPAPAASGASVTGTNTNPSAATASASQQTQVSVTEPPPPSPQSLVAANALIQLTNRQGAAAPRSIRSPTGTGTLVAPPTPPVTNGRGGQGGGARKRKTRHATKKSRRVRRTMRKKY